MNHLDKTERKIEILKLLHGREMRIGEIAEYFGKDDRTIRTDVDELREGTQILGSTFKIESKHEGNQKHFYKSTVHPILLGLNLSELLMLLSLLEDNFSAAGGEVYEDIFKKIYSQMTDYAEDIVAAKLSGSYLKTEIMNTLEEEAFEQSKDYKLVFWSKSSKYIEISYLDENKNQINEDVKLIDMKGHRLKIENKEGQERWVDYSDIAVDWQKVNYK